MTRLALAFVALLIYPGLAATGAAGLACEMVVRRGGLPPLRRWLRTRPPVSLLAAAVLGATAAAQLPAPLSPADPSDRNLLVAIVAVAALAWLGWAFGDGEPERPPAAALAAFAVGLLAPAVLAQDLHPQVVAIQALGGPTPVRVAAAALYVAAVPALGGLLGPQPAFGPRLWLWLPAGGLFAGVFFAPAGDEAAALLRYLALSAGVLFVGGLLGLLVRRAGLTGRYPSALWALTGITVLIAFVTALR